MLLPYIVAVKEVNVNHIVIIQIDVYDKCHNTQL